MKNFILHTSWRVILVRNLPFGAEEFRIINYLDAPRDESAWMNTKDNNSKLLRDGSFISYAWNSRSARRDYGSRDFRSFDFRGSVLSGYEGYEVVADVDFRVVAVAVA